MNMLDMESPVNPQSPYCTVCTGNTNNNIFFIVNAAGVGQCRLDQMTYEQVVRVLAHNPGAGQQLIAITDDTTLHSLANTVGLVLDPLEDDDNARRRIDANSLQFYTLFRGNIDGSVV
jgi:hypothetical protein